LVSHLRQLQAGEAIKVPVYDFATYQRRHETRHVEARGVILVEGILIFVGKELREMMDIKLYVDTDADLRFIRRLQRDTRERGRTVEMVIKQYLNTVRPMHLEFVEPSKRYADVIIPAGGFNEAAVQMIVARIEGMLVGEVS
jgi:uridine kinase